MKKVNFRVFIILASILFVGTAIAGQPRQITLYTHAVGNSTSGATVLSNGSGATSIATGSGATQLVIEHQFQKRSTGIKAIDMANYTQFPNTSGVWMVWLEDLDFCPAQIENSGTVSDTFDLLFEFYPKKGVESSVTRYAFKDEPITSLTDNVAGPYFIEMPPNCYVKPWLISGTTALGSARVGITMGLDGIDPGFVRSSASAYAMSAASGVETITIPAGVRQIDLTYSGDGDVDIEWDGGTASSGGNTKIGSGYLGGVVLCEDILKNITQVSMCAGSGVTVTRRFYY